jgi:Flp pilus assembly CpaF family ATPase
MIKMKHQPCLMTIEEQKQIKAFLSNSEKFIETVVEEIADEVEKRMDEKKPMHAKAFAFVGKKLEFAAHKVAETTVKAAHIVATETTSLYETAKAKVKGPKSGDFDTHCIVNPNNP